MDAKLIEELLYRGESETLDFKVQQYPFVGATDEDKSELLKDVLAFANAWRETAAYILIGVNEVPGAKSVVEGISDHLKDHELQQFVTSKVQRPIHFNYHALEVHGKQCVVIYIPVQEQRPYYLPKGFGKVKADTVYIRRGSSTVIAGPEEIARMGGAARRLAGPQLEIELTLSIKPRGGELYYLAKADLINKPGGASAHEVTLHILEMKNFNIDGGPWEYKKSEFETGKWISRSPIHPGERQVIGTWNVGDADAPREPVVNRSNGIEYKPNPLKATFRGTHWEAEIQIFAQHQQPLKFVCRFEKEEIEKVKTKRFSPV